MQDVADVGDVFKSVLDSILDVTVTITDEDGNAASDTVDIGDHITLPFPANFLCDDAGEKDAKIEVSFGGDGTITFDDFSLNMCAP